MTDESAEPQTAVPSSIDFEVIWPNDAAAGASVVTQFGILGDGDQKAPHAAGLFLLMGQIAPPPWFTDAARARGVAETKKQLHVYVRAAVYMTRARAEELHELLGKHLGKEQANG